MSDERYYPRSLEALKLNVPSKAQDLVESVQALFDAASEGYKTDNSLLIPERFHDDVNATTARWEWRGDTADNFERLGINLVGNSLLIALEHRHGDIPHRDRRMSPHDYPRTTLVLGAQKATIHASHAGGSGRLEAPYSGEGVVREFRFRLNHAMSTVGLRAYAPPLKKAS